MEIKNQLRIRADSFSNLWIFGILAVCFLPSALHFLGMDFGTEGTALDYFAVSVIAPDEATDAIYKALSGSFSHTILEWTAFCTAIFTVILAFIHFSINRDLTTPIIGMALFSALILITGTGLFLVRKDKTKVDKRLPYVLIVSFLFGVVAYLIIHISAGSAQLPQTMFPDAFITRPYDVIPLFLFIFAGIFLFPKFHRMVPNLFTHALILSIVPHVITQLHMSFGSTNLFDTHFNIAHFVKIIAYFVPFIGLTLDYYKTYLKEKQSVLRLEQTNTILEKQKIDLDQNIVERKQREIERELLIKGTGGEE